MEIEKKDLFDIIEKKLFSAGVELLNQAFEKLGYASQDTVPDEIAISSFNLVKEGMHTDISKKAVEETIEDLKKLLRILYAE